MSALQFVSVTDTLFHHLAFQHSFVAQVFGQEHLAETLVGGQQAMPHVEESLFQQGGFVEGGEEVAERLDLLWREKVERGEVVDVCDVDKEVAGIDHVVVDVLEVGQHQFAPRPELVERLSVRAAATLLVRLVEHTNELDGVGHGECRERLEQFADAGVAGCPDGVAGKGEEVLVEKEAGTLIGKHHRQVLKMAVVATVEVFGNELEICLHSRSAVLSA